MTPLQEALLRARRCENRQAGDMDLILAAAEHASEQYHKGYRDGYQMAAGREPWAVVQPADASL